MGRRQQIDQAMEAYKTAQRKHANQRKAVQDKDRLISGFKKQREYLETRNPDAAQQAAEAIESMEAERAELQERLTAATEQLDAASAAVTDAANS